MYKHSYKTCFTKGIAFFTKGIGPFLSVSLQTSFKNDMAITKGIAFSTKGIAKGIGYFAKGIGYFAKRIVCNTFLDCSGILIRTWIKSRYFGEQANFKFREAINHQKFKIL